MVKKYYLTSHIFHQLSVFLPCHAAFIHFIHPYLNTNHLLQQCDCAEYLCHYLPVRLGRIF